jgi:phenylalanyl-tRNA synthetase beta chain
VLDTLVTMFSQYCATPFEVEPVETVLLGGQVLTFPKLAVRKETILPAKANSTVGVDLKAGRMAELLTKMCLASEVKGGTIEVTIPTTRHDVLHPCDIYKDVAIAHCYNNITKVIKKGVPINNPPLLDHLWLSSFR